ncbi:MAG: adaptor protein MecA [Aerococcus sp.]|nr:adaptor protein MecA [Aerococcus sp.]
MEFEYLNENTMRVFIGPDDLAERGVSLVDLLQDQSQVEQFFMSILEEADVSNHFQQSDAITFQVMPKQGGLDLYISKSSTEMDEDGHLNVFRDILKDISRDVEAEDEEEMNQEKEQWRPHLPFYERGDMKELTILFRNLHDLLTFAKSAPNEEMDVDLYQYHGEYIMTLHFSDQIFSQFEIEDIAYRFLEYGELTPVSQPLLREHGELLLEKTALQQLKRDLK